MQCPECHSDIATNELYCGVCGAEVRLGFDEVFETVSEEIAKDKEESTEAALRNMLLWFGFFMITAWTFDCESENGLIGPEYEDQAYHIPVYQSRASLVDRFVFEDRSVDTVAEIEAHIEANLRRKGRKK